MQPLPKKTIVTRYTGNPIITSEMIPYSCRGVYNSSAAKCNGRYYMVLRCEDYNWLDYFMVAESNDGYRWSVRPEPMPCRRWRSSASSATTATTQDHADRVDLLHHFLLPCRRRQDGAHDHQGFSDFQLGRFHHGFRFQKHRVLPG